MYLNFCFIVLYYNILISLLFVIVLIQDKSRETRIHVTMETWGMS